MKKLLIFMLVFGMASLANATVIDLVIDKQMNYEAGGIGGVQQYGDDSSHAGTSADPIGAGETLHLVMSLQWIQDSFPGGGYPSYDGYLLSAMDLTLTVSGGGSLMVNANKKNVDVWGMHTNWSITGTPTIASDVLDTSPFASNFNNIGVTNGLLAGGSDQDLLFNFYVTADGSGDEITLTWGLAATPPAAGQYADYTGDGSVEDPTWQDIGTGSLGGQLYGTGNMQIYTVPEPMTVLLLGLGGLFLRRRRR